MFSCPGYDCANAGLGKKRGTVLGLPTGAKVSCVFVCCEDGFVMGGGVALDGGGVNDGGGGVNDDGGGAVASGVDDCDALTADVV